MDWVCFRELGCSGTWLASYSLFLGGRLQLVMFLISSENDYVGLSENLTLRPFTAAKYERATKRW